MPDTKMVKVADYCNVIKGKIGIKKAVEGEYPLVTTAEERLSHNEYHFDRPSVIIPLVSSTGHGHASLKRIHYQEGKFAVGSILCAVTPKDENILNAQFLYHYLDVYKEKLLVSRMRGMANVTLPVTEIEEVKFPLLPTNKQKEWVSLFENTSSYTGSLTSEIDYQQSLLKKLRQSILQDVISGKLTEKWRRDNPDVEPASELLARIKAEKERLVKEKKIKKEKPLPIITEDEIPFDLPEGWVWCRMGELIYEDPRNGYSPKAVDFVTKVKTLKLGATTTGKFIDSEIKFINEHIDSDSFLWLKPGDILIQRSNSIDYVGVSAIFCGPVGEFIYPDLMMKIQPHNEIDGTFLHNVLLSPFVRNYFRSNASGTQKSMPKINQTTVAKTLIPLPPKQEVVIMLSKLKSIFAYCDKLEQQINKSQQDSELLMQAVLKEAFETK